MHMFGSIRDRISFSNVFSVICSTLIVTGLSASLLADQPAKKDSNARLQPKSAAWSTKVEPSTAKPGEKVKFTASVKLQPGWHLYKYTKQQPETGPRQTEFDLFTTTGLKTSGDWKPSKELIKKKEPAFPELPYVEFYEDQVSFSIDLEVPANATSGDKSIQVQVFYQLCNAQNCSIPGRWTLPAAVLVVQGGQAAVAPVVAPPVAKVETPSQPAVVAVKPSEDSEKKKAESTGLNPAVPEKPVGQASDVQKSLDQGLIPFLIVCAGGGLVSLIMPCVWPMVPITVNFFIKQGQGGKGTTKLAVAYCFSIIAIFTLVGVLFSAFFGAA